jgi:hypothetical protein
MPTKPFKPLPRALRYLQAFVNKLAKLGPEGHKNQEIDTDPLDAALRKHVAELDRRAAKAALEADRELLRAWLGRRDHPAFWVLGYLSGQGLMSDLRRRPSKPKPKPKHPRRSAIFFATPGGWTVVKSERWRLVLKAKGLTCSIEEMSEAEYDAALRMIKPLRPVPRPRGAPKLTITSSNIRRGQCSGKKYVHRRSRLALSKQVHYVLRVPGGGVTIVLDGTGKVDLDESPLESKLNTLRVRGRP